MSDLIKDISDLIDNAVHLLDVSKLHSSLPKIEDCLRDAKNKIDDALGKIEDSRRCHCHCFCRNDALGVLHCCKCGQAVQYEYKPYEWKVGLPGYRWYPATTSGSGTAQGKYLDVPTSSDEFAMRKEK